MEDKNYTKYKKAEFAKLLEVELPPIEYPRKKRTIEYFNDDGTITNFFNYNKSSNGIKNCSL